jgi:hypothetical protein
VAGFFWSGIYVLPARTDAVEWNVPVPLLVACTVNRVHE